MAVLQVQQVSKKGIVDVLNALSPADAAGDSVPSAPGLLIVMDNTDASAHTLTVAAPVAEANCGNYGALTVDPLTLVLATNQSGFLAIPNGYVDANNNFAWTYDAVTGVKIGVFSIAP